VKRSAAVVIVVIVIAVMSGLGSASGQTQTDIDGYISRLNQATLALRPGIDPRDAIANARSAMGLPLVVTLPDGSSILVTDRALFGTVAETSDTAAVTAMRERVFDASSEALRVRGATPPDRARVDAAIAAAYGGLTLDPPSWGQRVLDRIGQAIGWFLDHTFGALARSGAGGLVGWLLVIAMAVGAVLLARRVRVGVVADARVPRGADGTVLVDWQRFADDALASGDLNAAVPALYHVLVGTLAYHGVVRDAPSLTAGECRGAVRVARPSLAPSIDRATAAFERVAYGKRDAHLDDVEALRTAQREVRSR
jgi:hypothetical protein